MDNERPYEGVPDGRLDDNTQAIEAELVEGEVVVLRPDDDTDIAYVHSFKPQLTRGEVRAANRRCKDAGVRPLFSESVSLTHEVPKSRVTRRLANRIGSFFIRL